MGKTDKFWIGFGDIHDDLSLLADIPNLSAADGVIISGDITNRGGTERASKLMDMIYTINPNIYAQIGNMDQPEVTAYLDEEGWNIHAKGKQLSENVGIMGVGYSTPTPFMTPAEVSEKKLTQWIEEAHAYVKHLPRLILVAHDPPFGSRAALLPSGENVGNRSVLDFIRRVQPDVCLTGHIHEGKSEEVIGKTKV
ncbi:MAG: metallophosphoesterase, partial [Deltaproteobacteria bacterium]|nr:metallophosphoesterase [Deltaproteobacteria bacterium]